MARSMTGYGRAQNSVNNFDISVELKSVNHKFFDFSVHLPRTYLFLEDKLKTFTQSKVGRGKIEMFVSITDKNEDSVTVEINEEFSDAYYSALMKLKNRYSFDGKISVTAFASHPDVLSLTKKELDEDLITEAVLSVASDAVDKFCTMREVEGKKLCEDVIEKTEFILDKVAFIEKKSPETVNAYRLRLEEKIKELLGSADIDEQRIVTETAIFADKVAVDEETVRLRSHISQLRNLLLSDEPIGRKLDFIVQEMNREANTTGSKAQDIEITNCVVDIKSAIEKIREQIQNIE